MPPSLIRTSCPTAQLTIDSPGADLLFDGAMGADVHTIQELSDILALYEAALADQGARLRHQIDVGTGDGELVLGARLVHLDTLKHVDDPDAFLAQEVSQLNGLPAIGDGRVDGEVSIHQ